MKTEEMQFVVQSTTDEQCAVKDCKPAMENKVLDLQGSVDILKTNLDLFMHELSKLKKEVKERNTSNAPAFTHLGVTIKEEAPGQFGHREANPHRSSVGAGVLTTLLSPPVKGTNQFSGFTHVPIRGFVLVPSKFMFVCLKKISITMLLIRQFFHVGRLDK